MDGSTDYGIVVVGSGVDVVVDDELDDDELDEEVELDVVVSVVVVSDDVVVSAAEVVVASIVVVVGIRFGCVDSVTAEPVWRGRSATAPGAIGSLAWGERTLAPILGPAGPGDVVVVELSGASCDESESLGLTVSSTVTALNARGAATARAVTVDKDSANRNRPRPVVSSGRCEYIAFEFRARGAADSYSLFSIRIDRAAGDCGINRPVGKTTLDEKVGGCSRLWMRHCHTSRQHSREGDLRPTGP